MHETEHFSALPITIVRGRGGTMSKMPIPIMPKGTRFFDLLGMAAFGKPIILLLVFLARWGHSSLGKWAVR
jgi:hypothetical protein